MVMAGSMPQHKKTCQVCGELFAAIRKDKRTCSASCKKALQRGGWKRRYPAGGRPIKGTFTAVEGRSWTSSVKGDNAGTMKDRFPSGTILLWRWTRQPVKVCWESLAGSELKRWLRAFEGEPSPGDRLPIATFNGTREEFLCDLLSEAGELLYKSY